MIRFLHRLLVALACLASAAHAQLADEIQVYDDGLNGKGKYGLELHLNNSLQGRRAPAYLGEIPPGNATRVTFEGSYGLGGGFEAGAYLDNVVTRDGTPQFAGAKLRLKWIGKTADIAPDGSGGGWFYGLNMEVGRVRYRFDEGRWGIELRPILGWRNQDWTLIVNPILDWTLKGADAQALPYFNPGAKVSRRVGDGVALGVEAYRDFGSVGGFAPPGQEATQIFAVIDVTRGRFPFNLGIGRGFGGADAWAVKAIFSLF
ncbi:MAG: hypothetical protein WCO11_00705 [Sphingomonadales bacterium]|jgi:hypothetical protein